MTIIRVTPSVLRQSGQDLAQTGSNTAQTGRNVWNAGASAPSYDGQFGSRVRDMAAEANSRAASIGQNLGSFSARLQSRADAFDAADTMSLASLGPIQQTGQTSGLNPLLLAGWLAWLNFPRDEIAQFSKLAGQSQQFWVTLIENPVWREHVGSAVISALTLKHTKAGIVIGTGFDFWFNENHDADGFEDALGKNAVEPTESAVIDAAMPGSGEALDITFLASDIFQAVGLVGLAVHDASINFITADAGLRADLKNVDQQLLVAYDEVDLSGYNDDLFSFIKNTVIKPVTDANNETLTAEREFWSHPSLAVAGDIFTNSLKGATPVLAIGASLFDPTVRDADLGSLKSLAGDAGKLTNGVLDFSDTSSRQGAAFDGVIENRVVDALPLPAQFKDQFSASVLNNVHMISNLPPLHERILSGINSTVNSVQHSDITGGFLQLLKADVAGSPGMPF